MKGFVQMGLASILTAAAAVSCCWMPEEPQAKQSEQGHLVFSFIQTKAAEQAVDTNDFILKVKNALTGETIYEGSYGKRPKSMSVTSGSYEVCVISEEFSAPAFDVRQFGDQKVVVATAGETMAVHFLCKQSNCGINLSFTDIFLQKYGNGTLKLKQDAGTLDYRLDEKRTAYVLPGNLDFYFNDGETSETRLFSRNVAAGEVHNISIDATRNESSSDFSIEVDTTVVKVDDTVVIGRETENSGDGLSIATALSINQMSAHIGDTVWVWGYVIGTVTGENVIDFAASNSSPDNNLAIASEKDESDASRCGAIYLSKAVHKNDLGLNIDSNRKKLWHNKIYVLGKIDSYKKVPAVKNVCEYKLE